MARIAVIGGSGYAGRSIIAEAVSRGHTVLAVARRVPSERHAGAIYIEGSLTDVPDLVAQLIGVDVVVSAVAPRGDMLGLVRPNITALVTYLPDDVRVGVIGGAVSALVTPEGERLVDLPSVADEYMPEALESVGILDDLKAGPSSLDWFHLRPTGGFEGWDAEDRSEADGGWIVTDAEGEAHTDSADLAVAVVDEIEQPRRTRTA
ncbi:NAD(P)-dependent oxidoreductase [Microbacterium sp. ASV49]|uniref:NAD(P)H-binding protein n=1 Tax=Microbacterium candidum TaxID=3041922 RepID=A0ABT7N306_9MICO|nr:NAD(P)H-binding protein [Microbacterium sp. ASV49]MDL9981082.1 NAD(P)H-binding protein [Microbacterium sp. ASV49]